MPVLNGNLPKLTVLKKLTLFSYSLFFYLALSLVITIAQYIIKSF
jgi:hypothetical protein